MLNAYGLDYLIEENINTIEKLPELRQGVNLLDFSWKLQSLYQDKNPDKNINVVIDRYDAFIKIRDCSDGCLLQDHQSSVSHPNNLLLNCKSSFGTIGEGSHRELSRSGLALEKRSICGINFSKK
jgi:hypothetical protein